MFRKALVPVDGSQLATAALAQVPHLLGSDGEAVVVEVVDSVAQILTRTTPAGFAMNMAGNVIEPVVRAQHEAAAEHLAAAEATLRTAGIARVETRIVQGEPGPALVEMAQSERCDVVVMATHGRSGLKRAVLGSVADHVIRHLGGIPVLLVHPDGEAVAQPRADAAVRG